MLSLVCAVTVLLGQGLKRDIPNESWEPVFFGNDPYDVQSINGRAKLSNLPALREKILPKGHVEVRIWQGFGVTYLEGYRFYFDGGKWRGWKLEPAIPGRADLKAKKYLSDLKPPTMGWPEFWKGMEREGLYTLPDFDSLPIKKNTVLDGMSYVVEFQKAGLYRTYSYNNPSYQPRGKEVDSMLSIAVLLRKAFPRA